MTPVRTVLNHKFSSRGLFPSQKMGRMVAFESLLELDLIHLLEFSPRVTAYEEQPLHIPYIEGGKKHRYTPDFSAIDDGQKWLYECKPACFVNSAENQVKYAAAREWCAKQAMQFCVVTENDLRAGFRLNNVKLLHAYARHEFPVALQAAILSALYQSGSATSIADLAADCCSYPRAVVYSVVLQMAYRSELVIPVDTAPITFQTPVSLNAK